MGNNFMRRIFIFMVFCGLMLGGLRPSHAQSAPFPTRDWAIADPASQNMDPARLQSAHQMIRSSMPHVHSLVVVRNGYLVWESYYGGYRRNSRHAVMSVTKSVTSLLVGVARDRGLVAFESQVAAYFPEYFPAGVDGRKLGLQVRHLLALRSGIQWTEYPPFSREAQTALNSVDAVLNLPMIASPDERWWYSSGDYHLLAGILTRATGMPPLTFADQTLFAPMGITNRRWQTDANGTHKGGIGLALTPRDMAKIGLLTLGLGYWDGQYLVSGSWIELSTQNAPNNAAYRYGYGWWTAQLAGQRVYYAAGYGGQLIVVVPALGLIAVMTGAENVSPPVQEANSARSLSFIENQIIPAAR
jgi:CubicO group peptidase (beta-lactamase class C family)